MLAPYPEIKINQSHQLAVSDLHTLHIEESGSAEGNAVLVIHDGPGCGSDAYHRRLFDAERYRIIQFDQRGCGRSHPYAETRQNSLAESVTDVSAVLQHLGITKSVLVAFGWGARIAVEFARANPDKVNALVLCGYGYESKTAVDWIFGRGAKDLFPDEWMALKKALEVGENETVLAKLITGMSSANEFMQIQTAKAWVRWLARISSLHVHQNVVEKFLHPHNALTMAKLGAKILSELASKESSDVMPELTEAGLRSFIVHGRYDAVCPLAHSYDLHQRWPGSELLIVRDAGHSVYDPAMTDTMLRTIGQVADLLDDVEKLNG